jgi:transcriptional regulator with XRE-family HTH domain
MAEENKTYLAVGKIIKAKREEAKMTQEDLAQKISVTAATISLYESGLRKPEMDKIKMISSALGTSEAVLLGIKADNADIDLALRSEKLDIHEINQVKNYIKLIKDAKSKR